jgi:hypothetical protein
MEISVEKLVEEYSKCYSEKDRIYMIENYLKTYDGTQENTVPFILFPRQREFLMNMVTNEGNITLKPRQTGYSTVACAKIACEMILANEDKPLNILVIAQNLNKAKENAALIKQFIKQIPLWFFGTEFIPKNKEEEKEIWNKKIFTKNTLTDIELFNGAKVYVRAATPNASNGISAVSILFCDEAAYWENGLSVFTEAVRTTSTIKNKLIIMVSTPNGRDELYYEYYHKALEEKNNFKVTQTKWTDDPRYNRNLKFYKEVQKFRDNGEEYIDTEWKEEETIDKQGNVLWQPEKWKKLEGEGWKATSPWYVKSCAENNHDRRSIAQSLECSFIGSDAIAVDPKIIDMQKNLNVFTEYKTDPLQPDTHIFKPPIPNHRYIMGIDGSRGDAGDNATIEVFDIDAVDENNIQCLEQVLEYSGKMAGDLVGELAYKYGLLYNNAFCVVDCIGGYGEAAVLTMLRLAYPNLYYDSIAGKEYLIDSTTTTFVPNKEGQLPGFHSKGARNFMIQNFINKLRDNVIRIRSMRVVSELETWIINSSGKIEHKSGKHDDTLTNLSMGLFIYENNFLKLEKQKEMDKAIIKTWIESLKPFSMNTQATTETKHVHPAYYNYSKVYTGTNSKNPYMWVFGKDLKPKQKPNYRNPYI